MSTLPGTTSTAPQESSTAPSQDEPTILRRQREALRSLLRLVSERAAAEAELARSRTTNDTLADQEYEKSRQGLVERRQSLDNDARISDERGRRAIVDAAIAGEAEAKAKFGQASRRIASDFDFVRERAKSDAQRARAEIAAAFEASEKEAARAYATERKPIDDATNVLESMRARVSVVLDDYGKLKLKPGATAPSRTTYRGDDLVDQLFDILTKAKPSLELLEGLVIPKSIKGKREAWLFIVPFLLLLYPFAKMQGFAAGAGIAAAAAGVLGFLLRTKLFALAKFQLEREHDRISQSLVDASALIAHLRATADERLRTQRTKNAKQRNQDLQTANENHQAAITNGENNRDEQLRKINEVYAQKQVEIQTTQQRDIRNAMDSFDRRTREIEDAYRDNATKLDERYQTIKAKLQSRHESAYEKLKAQWRDGMAEVRSSLDEVNRQVDAIAPKWDDPAWSDRPFARAVPPALPFGEVRIDLDRTPQGVSPDAALMEGIATSYRFPTLRAFPAHGNLLIEAPAEGRAAALGVLQAAMFRLLTTLPPGQVRFTIIDPVGIGRNFGAFMHLADFDEVLVTNQVWTEPRQIEERLADLSAHMERVTQRYLRNEYATIDEYNAVAGEVAEPYRVLVVADYPTNFDDKAANRLASIAAGGVPCGVLTLVAVDRDKPLPPGVTLDDLRANALVLTWEGGRLTWADPDFGRFPLALDAPPPPEFATRLIQRSGAAARDAKRVEVPFEFIAPSDGALWVKDSRGGIDVPLGKSGATKRQHLSLGHGTSQHVLIAGRTGSGKSTLLHALIVNLALNYSPDEVDLYLIDFKKGVEFKVYATQGLPHASVVAIESEREFGISVLQRLDAEMRHRGERFRDAGVQDVNGYRGVPGAPPLPRVLLIIDEFQEFFVEEDKVAQEAALLLDRLVRQGRAFGVHVHLGTQSLGGAYALARNTVGQMAVRIALQCSDADASLILSEQNTAAKLLSRPGEAVYNDANGLPEGNHFFQVVWLSDERREAYLKQLRELAAERKPVLTRTPIVFEGDTQASLSGNATLSSRLEAPTWPSSPRSSRAWLGEAVAIKDPTSALFRRQAGNHLLVVGQNEELALGIMASALVGLAAQYPPAESETVRSGARFAILDGTPEDHPQAEALARVAEVLTHPVTVGGWREAPKILATLAEEVERRQQPDADDGPEIFLFVHDLGRFRDLRKRENEFSFSRRDEDAGPTDHLATILTEGPALGVHILAWCDNLNNLNRSFDHHTLRNFEMRVLFQMSANDSAHLLDSPLAAKLGPHRAFFASEDQNHLEKFRPYALPDDSWLAHVRERFRQRSAPVG